MNTRNIAGIYRSEELGIIKVKLAGPDKSFVVFFSGAPSKYFSNADLIATRLSLVDPATATELGFTDEYEYIRTIRHDTALMKIFHHEAPEKQRTILEYVLGESMDIHEINIERIIHHFDQPANECVVTFRYEMLDPSDSDRTITKNAYIRLKTGLTDLFGTEKDIMVSISEHARAMQKKELLEIEAEMKKLSDRKKKLSKMKL